MSCGNNGFFGFSTADAILTIEELDGAPSLKNLRKILVSNGTLTDNGDNTATLDTGGGGSGGVTGPVSSTDNAVVRWNGTGGDTIQDSGIIVDDDDNMSGVGGITLAAPNTVILSSDTFTWTQSYTLLAAQSGSVDNLVTISGGSTGRLLTIQPTSGNTITVKHNVDNIRLSSGADYVLSGNMALLLIYDGAFWIDVTLSGINLLTAKGDLLTRSASAIMRLPVGSTQGYALVVESNETAGIKYRHPHAFPITNATGNTVAVGDVGIIAPDATYGDAFFQSTAGYERAGIVAVVVDIGANGNNATTIWVAKRGVATITLDGNCSVGDYIFTSTTARRGTPGTLMRPQMFAKALTANGGGAGGTCEALLYTATHPEAKNGTTDLFRVSASSATAFTATIASIPAANKITYTPVSGNENTIVPVASSQLLKQRLWNTTNSPADYALISSVNTGINEITFVGNVPGTWAVSETVSIESQATQTGLSYKFVDLDLSQTTQIPALVRNLNIQVMVADTATATGANAGIYPHEAWGSAFHVHSSLVLGFFTVVVYPLAVLDGLITSSLLTSGGAGSGDYILRMTGYDEAIP